MRQKFGSWAIAGNCDESHLKSGSSGVLHGWNAVGVVGDEGNKLHRPVCGDRSHIETDPHINAFLFKFGFKIGIGERGASWRERDARLLKDKTSELQYADANGKKVFAGELMQPCVGPREGSRCTADGLDCAPVVRRAIVEENSVNFFVRQRTRMGDFFDVVWDETLVGFAGVYAKMPTIDEDRNLLFHDG